MKPLDNMTGIPLGSIVQQQENNRLRGTEKDVAAMYGEHRIERRFRKDGSYSWRVKMKANEQGTPTRDFGKAVELMRPWAKAEVERVAALNGFPGDYGVTRKPVAMGPVCHTYCERCDRLEVWCECPPVARAPRDARARRGQGSRRGHE